MEGTKCKNCNCKCHCSLKEHGDMYGVCSCTVCEHELEECEVCQQIQKNAVVRTQKKKKTKESVASKKNKSAQNNARMNIRLQQRSKMNKLYLVLALLFALSACSVGKKCTYTQDGTKISSYVWFFQGDKPIDLDKNNCSQEFMEIDEVSVYLFNTHANGVFNSLFCRNTNKCFGI